MVNSKHFVKRLEKILEYYSMSATAFAEKVDFNRSTISHLLSGRNKPSLEFVMKLLKEFPEVEMNWLLYGKGSFPSTPESLTEEAIPKRKKTVSEEKELDLFSESVPDGRSENDMSIKKNVHKNEGNAEIDKIVIFYRDGTFNVYQN